LEDHGELRADAVDLRAVDRLAPAVAARAQTDRFTVDDNVALLRISSI
jgi:hypothetical protein